MNTLAKVLNKIHMIYLGLLPAAATFFVMQGLEKVSREGALIFFI